MSKKNRHANPWTPNKPKPSAPPAQVATPAAASAPAPIAEQTTAPISPAQLAANRANALLSTGPRSEAGREKSSQNALKSALTGRTVLLPSDDVEEYAAFLAAWQNDLQPEGAIETELLQIIVDSHWRLRRIQDLENALYLHGERQFTDMFADESAVTRKSMVMLQTHLTYSKEFRNLHIQESRIDRKRAKTLKELEQLQSRRKSCKDPIAAAEERAFPSEAEELAAFEAGYLPPHMAEYLAQRAQLEQNGFDFSNQENTENQPSSTSSDDTRFNCPQAA